MIPTAKFLYQTKVAEITSYPFSVSFSRDFICIAVAKENEKKNTDDFAADSASIFRWSRSNCPLQIDRELIFTEKC